MALLPVLTYPVKSLKNPSKEVTEFNSRLVDLANDMLETMYANDGIGLAAAQIGENINLIVLDVGQKSRHNPDVDDPNPICMVNPKIVSREGIIIYEEGCLSCPELLVDMERAKHVTVQSVSPEGKPQSHDLSDLGAVCVQHEMDHLKGKLLTDSISRLRREIYGRQRVRERRDDKDRSLLE